MVRRGWPMRRSPWSVKRALLGGAARANRIVIEDRRQPFFGLFDGPALTRCVVLDLVALDAADAEVVALGVAEIKAARRGARACILRGSALRAERLRMRNLGMRGRASHLAAPHTCRLSNVRISTPPVAKV